MWDQEKCIKQKNELILYRDQVTVQTAGDGSGSCTEIIPMPPTGGLAASNYNIGEVKALPDDVVALDLSRNALEEYTSFPNTKALKALYLGWNPISSFKDIDLEGSEVVQLEVDGTKIENFEGFQGDKINYLNISHTPIKSLKGLKAPLLEKLSMRNMSSQDWKNIQFPPLTILGLSRNPGLPISEMNWPSGLSTLTIMESGLTSLKDHNFPSTIRELMLKNNKIEEVDDLRKYAELKVLDLGNNAMTSFDNLSLPEQLTELSLFNNKIERVQGIDFPKLKTLVFYKNDIKYFEIRESNLDMFKVMQQLLLPPNSDTWECPPPGTKTTFTSTIKVPTADKELGGDVEYSLCVISDQDFDRLYGKLESKEEPLTASVTEKDSNTLTILVVMLSIVVVIALGAFYIWRRRKVRSMKTLEGETSSGTYLSAGTLHGTLWNDPVLVSARIPLHQVKYRDRVAKGGYGEVYKGAYQGRTVAIKRLLPQYRKERQYIEGLITEVKLMAIMDHPCIVQFVGVAWDSLTDMCVVSEFVAGGDLRSLLLRYKRNGQPLGFNHLKIQIAHDVIQAIVYLHSLQPKVLHRDLKPRNVLLTEDLRAKLTDFGVSRETADHTMTAGVGTSLWMAPEVMLGERYDERADIFSFGILLTELDTHQTPYHHVKSDTGLKKADSEQFRTLTDAAILQMVANGLLSAEFSQYAQDDLVELGKACLNVDPNARPTAIEVSYKLNTILRGYHPQQH